jgi:tRNA-splicing endonuclease subunit Sen34
MHDYKNTQSVNPLILSDVQSYETSSNFLEDRIRALYSGSSSITIMAEQVVTEPFSIFSVAGRYILYDVKIIAHVRREHRIVGVLVGNIPKAAQQNVFSGIPLILTPEEARLLVLKGQGCIVDDVRAHQEQLKLLSSVEKREFVDSLNKRGLDAATASRNGAQQRKVKGLQRANRTRESKSDNCSTEGNSEELRFDSSIRPRSRTSESAPSLQPWLITPTTSTPPFDYSPYFKNHIIPDATPVYNVFAHVHSKGYFLGPGLRFGCQYMAYPGDPLRFHSHFLVSNKEWDEPVDLMDIVSGGRLGTGVKKSYLIGGTEPSKDHETESSAEERVKTYCIEWAAM